MRERKYTRSEQAIYDLLDDGHPHRLEELREALGDALMEIGVVRKHISNLRKKLTGFDITSTYYDCHFCYRIVKLIA